MQDDDLPSLAGLRVLLAVADGGSLASAGRSFGVSASAVGKSLTRLEARLGIRLFQRSTRSLTLTEEGRTAVARARTILAEAEGLRDALAPQEEVPSGRLRLSLPLVGEPFLGVLASFSKLHPAVTLDIEFADRQVDIIGEGFDAAIRSGEVQDTRLIARSLGSFQMLLAASPDYLDIHGRPGSLAELERHRRIRFRFAHNGQIGPWPSDGDQRLVLSDAIVSNDLEARVAFAVAGVGIGFLPSFAIQSHLSAGRLETVLPDLGQTVPLTLLWPTSLHLTQRMRAFSAFAVREFRSHLG